MRLTRQRKQVFSVLLESKDHPTAEEIFHRAHKSMPEISFATVYNSLSMLVQCGLAKQVTLDRSPARYCPNMREHCHFYCEVCGEVTDIELSGPALASKVPLPANFVASSCEMSMKGRCGRCVEDAKD